MFVCASRDEKKMVDVASFVRIEQKKGDVTCFPFTGGDSIHYKKRVSSAAVCAVLHRREKDVCRKVDSPAAVS